MEIASDSSQILVLPYWIDTLSARSSSTYRIANIAVALSAALHALLQLSCHFVSPHLNVTSWKRLGSSEKKSTAASPKPKRGLFISSPLQRWNTDMQGQCASKKRVVSPRVFSRLPPPRRPSLPRSRFPVRTPDADPSPMPSPSSLKPDPLFHPEPCPPPLPRKSSYYQPQTRRQDSCSVSPHGTRYSAFPPPPPIPSSSRPRAGPVDSWITDISMGSIVDDLEPPAPLVTRRGHTRNESNQTNQTSATVEIGMRLSHGIFSRPASWARASQAGARAPRERVMPAW